MNKKDPQISAGLPPNRRAFLKKGVAAAGAATMGVGLLNSPARTFARENAASNGRLNRGDAAILRFLQALETIEADLWIQYAELGGAGANTPGTTGNSPIDLVFEGNPVTTALAPLCQTADVAVEHAREMLDQASELQLIEDVGKFAACKAAKQ